MILGPAIMEKSWFLEYLVIPRSIAIGDHVIFLAGSIAPLRCSNKASGVKVLGPAVVEEILDLVLGDPGLGTWGVLILVE